MLSRIGMGEFIIIIIIALFVVGPDRLPKLAKEIGKAIAKFRKSINAMTDEMQDTQEGLGTLTHDLNKLKSELDTTMTDAVPREKISAKIRKRRLRQKTMGRIGITELLIILAIALVVFGPKALPKLGESIGKALSGFRNGMKEDAAGEPKEKTESDLDHEQHDG